MTRIFIFSSVVMFIATSALSAQEPAPTTPPQPEVASPVTPLPPVDAPRGSPTVDV